MLDATKNAFSTVIGTFNSNESMTGSYSSGVANMISGMANKVTNSNGAIVMGAGNSVKESSSYIDASPYSKHFDSVADMQKALMGALPKVQAVPRWLLVVPTALKRPRTRRLWAWGTP